MTLIIVAGVLGLIIGTWYLTKSNPKPEPVDLPCTEDLAPEATPTPALVEEIAKKNTAKKKISKNTAKNKSLAKMEAKPKKKSTKK